MKIRRKYVDWFFTFLIIALIIFIEIKGYKNYKENFTEQLYGGVIIHKHQAMSSGRYPSEVRTFVIKFDDVKKDYICMMQKEWRYNDLEHYDREAIQYHWYLIVHFSREETDDEYYNRLKREENEEKQRTLKEKDEYLRLKVKFENDQGTEFLQYKKAWICLQSSVEFLSERGVKTLSVDDLVKSIAEFNEEIKAGR